MPLITDPDSLSQGLETAVSDGAFTSSAGAATIITSAALLPTLAVNEIFEVRDNTTPGNNGLYIATGSPTSSSLPCTKIDGPNPTDLAAEAIRVLGDNGVASEFKSVHIDTGQKRIYLIEQGNLDVAGVTGQALYSFLKETTVVDFAISAAAGDLASFDSAGGTLPTVVLNDYVALSDMTNPENNGIWVVTDAAPTGLQFDARKVDGVTVVNEGAASHPLDLDPVNSPQAIVVNNNAGTPIEGVIGSASTAFDFDYDGNVQGGRTAATDANILIKAIGLEDAVYAETLGVITRTTGLSFSVVSPTERNYVNP